jgi:hypothetical protein
VILPLLVFPGLWQTLAFYGTATITAVKSFTVEAAGMGRQRRKILENFRNSLSAGHKISIGKINYDRGKL